MLATHYEETFNIKPQENGRYDYMWEQVNTETGELLANEWVMYGSLKYLIDTLKAHKFEPESIINLLKENSLDRLTLYMKR